MVIKVDINPQWSKIVDWFYANECPDGVPNHSIWAMLKRDYDAVKVYAYPGLEYGLWVRFPDEASYTAFLLRWA